MDLSWMAWTWPTAAFFGIIVLLLVGMTLWELRRPGGAPILVPTSFYPFVVDPGELQGVTERVTALRRAGREA